MALRYYFDLVCPYSYILGFEVERAEDDLPLEIEWLPFELRPAPKELPEPRGTYIRDHWRDHVYGLALDHGVEIHVPRYQPRSTLALALHSYAEEKGRGREYRDAAHRAFFIEGLDLGDEGVLRAVAREAGLDDDMAISAAWEPGRIQPFARYAKRPRASGCPACRRSPPRRGYSTTAPRRPVRFVRCWPTRRSLPAENHEPFAPTRSAGPQPVQPSG